MNRYTVNKRWPAACHYVPADSGHAMIKLRIQPSGLRMIIRAGIRKVTGNAIFETAYCAVDSLTQYFHKVLWRSARSLNLLAYAKQFDQDSKFGKAIGQVVCDIACYQDQITDTVLKAQWSHFNPPWRSEANCCKQSRGLLLSRQWTTWYRQGQNTLLWPLHTSIQPRVFMFHTMASTMWSILY
jgi:hypothetical protein